VPEQRADADHTVSSLVGALEEDRFCQKIEDYLLFICTKLRMRGIIPLLEEIAYAPPHRQNRALVRTVRISYLHPLLDHAEQVADAASEVRKIHPPATSNVREHRYALSVTARPAALLGRLHG
jgi:hypothetical protein